MKDEAAAQAQCAANILGVETLPGVRQFQPVEQADGHAGGVKIVVGQRHRGVMRIGANAVAGAIAGDHGPAGQAAAARAFDLGDAAGGQQLAAVKQRIGKSGRADQRGQPDREGQGVGQQAHGRLRDATPVRF